MIYLIATVFLFLGMIIGSLATKSNRGTFIEIDRPYILIKDEKTINKIKEVAKKRY